MQASHAIEDHTDGDKFNKAAESDHGPRIRFWKEDVAQVLKPSPEWGFRGQILARGG
jgi:hypothetical protein